MSKTKWYRKPIYLLVALALVLSLGIIALPMEGTVAAASPIYVNGSTGNNTWDGESADWDGTHGPKKTIQAGIAAVDSPGTVHVAVGDYYEEITLKDGVQVLGAGAHVTTIHGDGTDSAVTADAVGSGTKLDGFTITNGKDYYGGGMYIKNGSSPVISNCIFSGNSADYGGGMYNSDSSPTVSNCDFSGNSAKQFGGGMFTSGSSSPAVTNCDFSNNSATYGGGMYNSNSASPTVTNCVFSNNSVTYDGGGMGNSESSPEVTNCIFSGNSVTIFLNSHGGGMFNFRSSPNVTACVFTGNSVSSRGESYGGGMYNNQSSPTVTNCVFSDNSATKNGGGMYNKSSSSPAVTNCVFHGNSAILNGGGMYNDSTCSPDLTNCIVTSNTAGGSYSGGGVYWVYCLLADPDYNDFWDNSPDDYGSCSPGPHDISMNPMFVNPSAQDFHLMAVSPCIDAGTNDGAPSEDMDGNHRPIDGNGDGIATTDMGAYEYVPPPPPNVKYLHSTDGLFNLTEPVGTQWHELWPFFCKEYHLSSWNDTGGGGVLSYCDRIDMYEKPDGEARWYHVEEVTITLNVTQNRTGERMYIELEGGYNASVHMNPVGTQWHEIYPDFCRQDFCRQYVITGLHYKGKLEPGASIDLDGIPWDVEDVAVDIIVTIEPPPVGGEAYPVNKISLLAPWIAVTVLLAGGAGWYLLRRRRTQS